MAKTQEKVVEKLKTLETEQLVKATGELCNALRSLVEVVMDSSFVVDADASGKSNVDAQSSAATTKVDSSAGTNVDSTAEAMILLSQKKPTSSQPSQPTQPISQPTQPQPQQTQQLLEQERQRAKKEADNKKKYDEWEAERIRMSAEVEISKLVKIEEQEIPEFDVGIWIREFTKKKKKEVATARKKRKILRGPTPLQQRKEYEQYPKNMKGWKLVQLKNKIDNEVFKLYQQARREMNTFIAIGLKEDEEQIADMNKKMEPEKIIEAEQEEVKEAKSVEELMRRKVLRF